MSPVAYFQLLIGGTIYSVTCPMRRDKFPRTAEGYCKAVVACDIALRETYEEHTIPELTPELAAHVAHHVSKVVPP